MANNAVTAKSRAVSGKLLTRDEYISLLHKSSVGAVTSFLKTRPLYAAAFTDIDENAVHRARAESLIERSVFDNYIRILKFHTGKKDGIMSFYIRRIETEQLIKAVTAIASGSQESFMFSFPEYVTDYICFDPIIVAEAKDLVTLSMVLAPTPYGKPLHKLLTDPEPDVNKIITTINVCYIQWAFAKIDEFAFGSSNALLKDFFLRKTDADNLLMCYRMKSAFKADADRIGELLIPYHKRLSRKQIDEALRTSDPVSVLREMFVTERVATARVSDIPEINVNVSEYRYFRHRLAVSANEVEALYSLMMLMKAESTNLFRIIEGIRYGLPPEETEKYLIV
ncbi:MAG: V-type ATPase subunit [Ruminiclostridium sp.]|nr:V-type ATPase subunit [Ruminiclostridium sp.]